MALGNTSIIGRGYTLMILMSSAFLAGYPMQSAESLPLPAAAWPLVAATSWKGSPFPAFSEPWCPLWMLFDFDYFLREPADTYA